MNHTYTRGDLFQDEFEKLILDEIERLTELLITGLVEDFSEYKRVCGRISGLKQGIEYINEANHIVIKKLS